MRLLLSRVAQSSWTVRTIHLDGFFRLHSLKKEDLWGTENVKRFWRMTAPVGNYGGLRCTWNTPSEKKWKKSESFWIHIMQTALFSENSSVQFGLYIEIARFMTIRRHGGFCCKTNALSLQTYQMPTVGDLHIISSCFEEGGNLKVWEQTLAIYQQRL